MDPCTNNPIDYFATQSVKKFTAFVARCLLGSYTKEQDHYPTKAEGGLAGIGSLPMAYLAPRLRRKCQQWRLYASI